MSNLKYCETHQSGYLDGDECQMCKLGVKPITLSTNAAMTLARHMNMEPRFIDAESATFYFFGLKIVITKQPDDEIDLAAERQQAFEGNHENRKRID